MVAWGIPRVLLLLVYLFAADTCLPRRCPALATFIRSTIPAFSRHVILSLLSRSHYCHYSVVMIPLCSRSQILSYRYVMGGREMGWIELDSTNFPRCLKSPHVGPLASC
jgi:hypothetical protein